MQAVTGRDDAADPHRLIGMQEAVRARTFYAEDEVEEAGEEGRLAGFVRAVDEVKIRLAQLRLAKIEMPLREFAVADELQSLKPHQSVPPAPARP